MNWEQLAVQIPIVVAFIWFVLEMDKRNAKYAHIRDQEWREFLREQSKQSTAAMKEITQTIGRLVDTTERHDRAMNELFYALRTELKMAAKKKSGKEARVN